jgi:hypothetical protein
MVILTTRRDSPVKCCEKKIFIYDFILFYFASCLDIDLGVSKRLYELINFVVKTYISCMQYCEQRNPLHFLTKDVYYVRMNIKFIIFQGLGDECAVP